MKRIVNLLSASRIALCLPLARRLAISMGYNITLDLEYTNGARFVVTGIWLGYTLSNWGKAYKTKPVVRYTKLTPMLSRNMAMTRLLIRTYPTLQSPLPSPFLARNRTCHLSPHWNRASPRSSGNSCCRCRIIGTCLRGIRTIYDLDLHIFSYMIGIIFCLEPVYRTVLE